MSARRKRRRAGAEVHNDERWMASYMDMVTVLMCMFIVLFAMSSVDADKFKALSNSLATGFGQQQSEDTDASDGYVVPAELRSDEPPAEPTPLELAQQELDHLLEIRDRLDAALRSAGLRDAVAFDLDERGLVVRLVGAETYFTGNSAELSELAGRVLTVVGGVLAAIPNEIRVEGHADPHGSSGPFPTDWELASGRAARVVRFFVEQGGIAPARVVAIGYGSARPITDRTDEAGMSLNRRVDLLVVSDQPEDVRALLPELYARLGQPATAGG
jgi:chemotaxis protein MotB